MTEHENPAGFPSVVLENNGDFRQRLGLLQLQLQSPYQASDVLFVELFILSYARYVVLGAV